MVKRAEERRSSASLWPRMYCSSGAGKAGERGTAMAFAARMASHVTMGMRSVSFFTRVSVGL